MASTLTSHTRMLPFFSVYCVLFSVPYYSQSPFIQKKVSSKKQHPSTTHKTPPCHAYPKKEHPLAVPYQKKQKNTPLPCSSKKKNTPSPCLIQKKEHLLTVPHPKKEHPLTVPYQKNKRTPPRRAHPKKKNTPSPCSSKKKEHPLAVLIQKKKNTPSLCSSKKKEHPLAMLIQKKKVHHPSSHSIPLQLTKHSQNTPSLCSSKKKGHGIPLPLTEHPLAVSHPTKDNKTQMVKTKQTAKKTTGGRAPRVSLAGLKAREKHAAKSSKAHARKAPVAKKRRMRNLAKVTQLPVTFRCVSCHWKMTRFESPQPYFGFYLSGKPVLKHPLVVIGGFEHATTSEVAGNSTAIIHLHLESLELGHAPVHILHTMLQGYFRQDTYHFSQLPFNFATEESRAAYDTAASKLASSLTTFAKVVIFLTTHTDEDRGDLFSGMENKVPIATEVFELQFLQGLLLPLSNIVKGGDLIFFVCGSTVRKEQSFQGLKAAVQHFKPRSMLLFDAERLQPVTTIPFLTSVLDSTLVQGFHVQSAVRHSNIILMLWQEKVVVEKFVWTDKFIRPWGQQLPAQCPQCYSIQKWEAGCSGQTYSYECKNPGCGKDTQGTSQPPQTYTICMSKGATKLTQGKGQTSSWLLESL
ncbi:hypothetical protein F5J12DRAFT_787348 [Pisolithus orientalis]|uniref:uncharacterized protein n=1 Tax=Pisolithus orientalis TaxID=936130 RepID=UPI0022258B03|nr:uncharacterized protein F5J12DRAFT_787348 [Pisolithus orientalis]KAI5985708.1 hypothetical protein F5J12DRAFT_787348 [Pisolithus orientalis]